MRYRDAMNSVSRPGFLSVCTTILLAACGDSAGTTAGTTDASTTTLTATLSPSEPTDTSVTATESDTEGTVGASMSSEPTTTEGTDTTDAPTLDTDTSVDPSVPGVCGDGVLNAGEECDLGTDNGPFNGCSVECVINPSACGEQEFEAMLEVSPVDIIIVIDNSGSMSAEIEGVQNNINANFADILGSSGLDYRVILVSQFGSLDSQDVCIEAPLGGIPQGGCADPPNLPVNGDRFFHYSETIGSHNPTCKLLDTFATPDDNNFAPTGWQEWLRPEAFKTFIVLTDDGVACTGFDDNDNVNDGISTAANFDSALLALSELHFGTAEERNYAWYSIVAMGYNDPATAPWLPTDPVISSECETASGPGTGYQALSVLTDALRFPLCDTTSYNVVFQAIAEGVIKGAKVACSFPVPDAPSGQTIDLSTVLVEYSVGGMGEPIVFTQVPSLAECNASSFYIEGDTVYLCPAACDVVQDDVDAKIDIAFACPPIDPG